MCIASVATTNSSKEYTFYILKPALSEWGFPVSRKEFQIVAGDLGVVDGYAYEYHMAGFVFQTFAKIYVRKMFQSKQ